MAFRSDITIDWISSPRIITVLAPSTELSIQDLHDTCRDIEDQLPEAQPYPHLIDSAGKEPLGGGVSVGITATLNNARVAFEARPGPDFVQATISGGNLVAVDEAGDIIDPVQTTAYVQVVRTSSSSATLQELEDIQYGSFQNSVTIDAVNGTPGTAFPAGTKRQPVNNIADAKIIAEARGFNNFDFIGDFTFAGTDVIDGYNLFGADGPTKTTLTFTPGVSTDGCGFYNTNMTGTITEAAIFERVHLDGITFTGTFATELVMHGCILEEGGLTFSPTFTGEVQIHQCASGVPGSVTPIIDFNSADCDTLIRGYYGGIQLDNINQDQVLSIDFGAGQIVFDSTCTLGSAFVRGISKITDNSGANFSVDFTGEVISNLGGSSPTVIADAVWNEAIADHQTAGTAGKTLKDAKTRATLASLK